MTELKDIFKIYFTFYSNQKYEKYEIKLKNYFE